MDSKAECDQLNLDEFQVWSERPIVIDGESEGSDCVMKWYAQDEVNQEESEQNEVDGMKKEADSTGEVMHM